MSYLLLHEFHHGIGSQFSELNGADIVTYYGDWPGEYKALRESGRRPSTWSFRGRICLLGNDRVRFLFHGQITNDVKKSLLRVRVVTRRSLSAKGKMESDLNVFNLADELLLDFEPGIDAKDSPAIGKNSLSPTMCKSRMSRRTTALLSVAWAKGGGGCMCRGIRGMRRKRILPLSKFRTEPWGIFIWSISRAFFTGKFGFDIFVPAQSQARRGGGQICCRRKRGTLAAGHVGGQYLERRGLSAGIPRFGADMDETNLPMECIESRAMSFNKGCYLGQEVLNRIHAIGQVTKELRGLHLADDLERLPQKGGKPFLCEGKQVGYLTSAVKSYSRSRPTSRVRIPCAA